MHRGRSDSHTSFYTAPVDYERYQAVEVTDKGTIMNTYLKMMYRYAFNGRFSLKSRQHGNGHIISVYRSRENGTEYGWSVYMETGKEASIYRWENSFYDTDI